MISRPDVDTLLAGPLGGWLAEQAIVREDAKRESASRWWKVAIIGGPLLLFMWIALPVAHQFKFFATALVAGIGYAWGNAPRARAKKAVKIGINDAIAQALELSYLHDCEPGAAFGHACRYQMLPGYNRSAFEDLWHGEIAGRGFALHEAHLEERRGSGKNRRWVTVFRGAIIAVDFTRDFHGTTLIERADRHKTFFTRDRKGSIKIKGHRLDYVDMVHPDFDDDFCVFSDDQVEARYLVHPEYVERLIAVQRAFSGKDIRALFTGGDLIIVIESADMFESGSIEARDDRRRIERTVQQFASLADLATSLNERERGAA